MRSAIAGRTFDAEVAGARTARSEAIIGTTSSHATVVHGTANCTDSVENASALLITDHDVSSPSVILTLERALAANAPRGLWWMSAFGAGITCHGAFLEG